MLVGLAALRTARLAGGTLTDAQVSALRRAIRYSDNGGANTLYGYIGGHAAVADLARRLGLRDTASAPAADQWGATRTSPLDLVRLMHVLTKGGSPVAGLLHPDDVALVLELMGDVTPAQHWGVGGIGGQTATRFKNGWMMVRSPDWVINTFGDVRGSGRDLVIAVMQDEQRSQRQGFDRADAVCRAVFDALAQPLR